MRTSIFRQNSPGYVSESAHSSNILSNTMACSRRCAATKQQQQHCCVYCR